MARPSPISIGFRTAFGRPALFAGEIAWRWSCGTAGWAMVAFAFATYLNAIRVTNADLLLMKSRVPGLVAQSIQNIFRGTGPMLLRAAAVLLPAITVLWIAGASIGRWIGLRALLNECRGRFGTVVGLHFLRAAAGLAAVIGYMFALLVAGLVVSRSDQEQPGLFLLIFLIIATVVGFFHGRIRWYLSLATILAVRDGTDAFRSVSAAFDAYRDHRNDFLGVAVAIWALRLFLMAGATFVSLLPLGAVAQFGGGAVIAVLLGITLIYFALADFLFVVRQAAYVAILNNEAKPEPVADVLPPAPGPLSPATEPGAETTPSDMQPEASS